MCLTSFGDYSTGPPALPCSRNDALVGNGAVAPRSCISPLEMGTPTAAGGLLPVGITSAATRTTLGQPPLWFCPTEETNLKTSVQYASYYSSFWRINPLLAKGHLNKIRAKIGVRSRRVDRSSSLLPVFGSVARVALRGGLCKGVG